MRRNFKDPQYQKWRKDVYTRDKFQCRWPNCNNTKKLNAHHIKTWAQYPGLRFNINNGITLCKYHHDMIKGMEEEYSYSLFMILLKDNYDK
jgi:predicted restriction endonuclease